MAAPTPRDGVVGGTPTGTPEMPVLSDKQAKQEGIRLQNASGDALATAGYRVQWQPKVRPEDNITSGKDPDMRFGSNIADVVAPTSSDLDQVRKAVSRKVSSGQAYHVVLNLSRTDVALDEVKALLRRKPIAGLQELIVIEKNGVIFRVLPDPEQVAPASPSSARQMP